MSKVLVSKKRRKKRKGGGSKASLLKNEREVVLSRFAVDFEKFGRRIIATTFLKREGGR